MRNGPDRIPRCSFGIRRCRPNPVTNPTVLECFSAAAAAECPVGLCDCDPTHCWCCTFSCWEIRHFLRSSTHAQTNHGSRATQDWWGSCIPEFPRTGDDHFRTCLASRCGCCRCPYRWISFSFQDSEKTVIEGSGIGMPGWKCSVAGAADRVVKWRMKMAEMRYPVIKKERRRRQTTRVVGVRCVCFV